MQQVRASPAGPLRRLTRSADGPHGIVFLNWRDLSNPEGGGSELYVESVAARLAADGERVTIFCAAHPGAPRDEVKAGVRYLRRGSHLTVYAWAALLGRLGRFGPHDLVVEVQNGVPFLAALWSRRPVVVLVHHVHREQWSVVFGRRLARIGWWIESRLAPRVNRRCPYVAVSEVTKHELGQLGVAPDRVTVVYNGTSAPLSTSSPRASVPTIALIGRVVPHKRVELVLDAAVRLRQQLPELRIEIAGDGYWLPTVRQQVERLGLQDVVVVHGRVTEQEKADLLARAWVHAVPSLKEGWGLAVVEAGSHSTPSVAFRAAGGLAESIVDGSTGVLVDDVDQLHDALLLLLTDRGRCRELGRAAQGHAGQFTWAATAAAFSRVVQARRNLRLPVKSPHATRSPLSQKELSSW